DLGDHGPVGVVEDGAGGVVRRVDDQQFRRIGHRGAQPVVIEAEAGVGALALDERYRPAHAAGKRYYRRVGVVVRFDQDHFVAGFDQAEDRSGDPLGGADGDQYLRIRVGVDAVALAPVFGDGL